jgi:hypothetical protein
VTENKIESFFVGKFWLSIVMIGEQSTSLQHSEGAVNMRSENVSCDEENCVSTFSYVSWSYQLLTNRFNCLGTTQVKALLCLCLFVCLCMFVCLCSILQSQSKQCVCGYKWKEIIHKMQFVSMCVNKINQREKGYRTLIGIFIPTHLHDFSK